MLGELLTGPSHRFPVRRASVVAECQPGIHDECIIGNCAVHSDNIGIVLNTGKSTLDIIVAGVAIVVGIRDGEIPLTFAKVVKGVSEVEGWLVAFVGPVVNGVGAWPRAEAAVEQRAGFATVVEHIDETLGR